MYAQLAEWHAEHGTKIEILLYPSDEFGGQELPEAEIPAFVQKQGLPITPLSGCTLMAKVKVNGPQADPLWQQLKSVFPGNVGWNFAGVFLVDKHGQPIGRFDAKKLGQLGTAIKAELADEA